MISGILLAAGNSVRMGEQNKLLLQFNGVTLFERMVKTMENSNLDELIVVLGHDYKRMIPYCNNNALKLAVNGNHLEGQTTSITTGLQLVNPSSDAIMICLADMPLLESSHINDLIQFYTDSTILRPTDGNRPGNPSIFPKLLFDEIFNCQEKNGCKSVIENNQQMLQTFKTSDPAYFADIDTPSEYANFAL